MSFDPDSFLDAAVTDVMEKLPPLPGGSVYTGVIGEVKSRTWQGKKDPTQSGVAVDVSIDLDTSMVAGYPPKVTIKDGIMLEFKEGTSTIDTGPGKNGKLRKYKEALDMNKPGDSFSFRGMQGRMLKVKIKHREYEGELFNDVDSVAKA